MPNEVGVVTENYFTFVIIFLAVINTEDFTERLKQLMDYYQLSASAFADKIGVRPSAISHLLSGRNKPSLEFVLKILDAFKEVDLYWLLNGKGIFPKTTGAPTPSSLDNAIKGKKEIEKVVIFYKDGTFSPYEPKK